jgi:hypothetical protein
MNPAVRNEYVLYLLLAAGVLAFVLVFRPPSWYLYPILLALPGIVLYGTRTWKDRIFYILCAGLPLVIALSAVQLWAGVFAVWMLAGIVLAAPGMLASRDDGLTYAAFCGVTLVIAAGIDASGHVLLPLLITGTLAAVFVMAITVRQYRFRKQYRGASP